MIERQEFQTFKNFSEEHQKLETVPCTNLPNDFNIYTPAALIASGKGENLKIPIFPKNQVFSLSRHNKWI